jgi:chorismate synthase
MLRYLTAGESHGKALVAIVEGLPAGLYVTREHIDAELARRQRGYGRGRRMQIEQDRVEILAGIRYGYTLGSPVALMVENRDWKNWVDVMTPDPVEGKGGEHIPTGERVTRPRPGHADLVGALKYGHRDLRNVLERASARETTMRVAVGALAKRLLDEFGIKVMSHVIQLGSVVARVQGDYEEIFQRAEASEVRCADDEASEKMKALIDQAKQEGDTLGGIFEVVATGVPPGLGSHVHWDRKLDARLAQALMSIQAIKGVEVGLGFGVASRFGSQVHDAIGYRSYPPAEPGPGDFQGAERPGFFRMTNRAGGFEGGMTTGEPVVVRAAMKPISTLYRPLDSVDFYTKEPFKASIERSDTCALPAAGVIGEAVVAIELARAFLEKFGGDSLEEIRRNYLGYVKALREV